MALRPVSPIRARAETSINSAGTTPTLNYPSAVTAGDLLLFVCVSDTTQTITASGWTQLGSTNTDQTDSSAVFYKTAAGSEGGGTFTVSTSTTNRDFKAVCWAIAGGGTPEGNVNTGLSAAPTATSLTHSGGAGEYLNILAVMMDLNSVVIGWVTGLGDWFVPGTDIGSVQLSTASGLSASPTFNPGALVGQLSEGWHVWNIAVPISGLSSTGWPVMEGAAAVTHWTTHNTTQTMNLPSGIVSGEVLIAEICTSDGNGNALTGVPSVTGWTQLFTETNNTTLTEHVRGTVLYRLANGSEGATASVTMSISESGTAVVRRFSGVNADRIESAANNSSAAGANIPSLTHSDGSANILWLTGLAVDQDTGTPEKWASNGRYGLGGVWGETTAPADVNQGSVYSAFEGVQSASLTGFAVTLDQSRRHIAYTIALYPGASLPPGVGVPIGDTEVAIEVGFDSGPLDGSPVFLDISEYVYDMVIIRGRSGVLQRFETGTAVLRLNNDDGRFDPGNELSPYWPNLTLRTPIQLRAEHNSVLYTIFRGLVERWPITYGETASTSWVDLPLVDMSALLARRNFESLVLAAGSTDDRITAILDAVGWAAGLRDLDAGVAEVPAETLSGSALDLILRAADAEGGFFFVSADGSATFRKRTALSGGAASAATFADDGTGLVYSKPTFAFDDDTLFTQSTATRDGGVPQITENAAAVALYDRINLDVTGSFVNDNAALNVAQWLVARHKDVRRRVTSIEVEPLYDEINLWPQALGRELRDGLTIKFTPPGGATAVNQLHAIERIEHRMSRTGPWTTTFGLHPLATSETDGYWTLGTSELGTETRLA